MWNSLRLETESLLPSHQTPTHSYEGLLLQQAIAQLSQAGSGIASLCYPRYVSPYTHLIQSAIFQFP